MSSILWHTRDEGEARLAGPERAYMGLLVTDLAAVFLPHDMLVDDARRLLGGEHYCLGAARQHWARFSDDPSQARVKREALRMAIFGGYDEGSVVDPRDGRRLEGFSLALNTVMAAGNPQLQLLARLHAQCELHAWVDGPNRAWLAELIEAGRASGVYRAGMGWEDVAKLLRHSDDAPVVTSFTVGDPFPNSYISDWEPEGDPEDEGAMEEARDRYYDIPHPEQWDLSMAALLRMSEHELEITPDRLSRGFRHNRTLFEVLAAAGEH